MSQNLTPEEEAQKKAIFEALSPRQKKYVNRVGYEEWDPFQKPNDPIDIRTDASKRTTQQLVREFFHSRPKDFVNNTEYGNGVLEQALGVINGQDRAKGAYDFSVWHNELMKREGIKK